MKSLKAISLMLGLVILFISPCLGAETIPASGSAKGSIIVTNVVDCGAVPNDAKDDTAAVNAAINACATSDTKTLYFPGGKFNLATVTFPPALNVVVANGALLDIQKKATVLFNGPFTAGLYQVFSGPGNIQFGAGAVSEVYPQWWGASSASPDSSPAINKAINSSPSLPGVNVRLSGTFNCKTTIHVNRHRAHIIGDGIAATQLIFDPDVPAALFEFSHPDKSQIVQCSIRDVRLLAAGDYPGPDRVKKIGIKIVDGNCMEVRNIAIHNWGGKQSIGIHLQGRDFMSFENITILADLPILIDKNPNLDWISIDHSTFRNTYLLGMAPDTVFVKIASGVVLYNTVFEGTNSWVRGKYGLYWDDTESKQVSLNLSVKNLRMESGKADGAIIHISHNVGLQNLVVENIFGAHVGVPGRGINGIYLRKCNNVTLQNIFYSCDQPSTALDIDESSSDIVLINTSWNTGVIKTGKLAKTFGVGFRPRKSLGYVTTETNNQLVEVYNPPGQREDEGLFIYGTKTWCYSGELAKGAVLSLPVGSKLGTRVATITVSATDGAAINESGYFMVGANGAAIKVAGTNSVATAPTAGRLCLVPGNQVQMINNLGAKVDVVVTLFWNASGGKVPMRILLIGDSISFGYGPFVRDLLKGKADVQGPVANCDTTIVGLKMIDQWLGEGKWDVIYFNWGMHDLVHATDSRDPAHIASVEPQVSLPEYEKNLKKLVQRLKKTGAKLIWGTTTPIPEGCQWRISGEEVKYNEVALKVMQDENVPVDDLHAVVLPGLSEFQYPNDVHFNPKGSEFLAKAVARSITEQLNLGN
ncbi:MAG: glycosyl hydrolase family 28-related protein [Phycisphaerae bacterium]